MKFGAVLILIFSALACVLAGYKTYLVFTHPIKYENEIKKYAEMYDLDFAVVASLIKAHKESMTNIWRSSTP